MFIIIWYGCRSDEDIISQTYPVIDGWFSSNGYPVVIFTSSFTGEDDDVLADKVIKYGKVTVMDDEKEVILTAGPAKNYFPPFRYFSHEIIPSPGKRYRMIAEYKGMKAEAEGYMYPATPIDSIVLKKIPENDSLRSVELFFTAPEDTPAYYYITLQNGVQGSRPMPAMLGTAKVGKDQKVVSMPVFRPRSKISVEDYEPQLKIGEQWIINLNRVEEDVYIFWREFDNTNSLGHNQFISNQSVVKGNVKGGFGIFSVQGTSSLALTIK